MRGGDETILLKSFKNKFLKRIKVLKGFLPICASCKQIRDKNGDWHHLEEYIDSHSEAKFSHGLCPECSKKYLKEIDG